MLPVDTITLTKLEDNASNCPDLLQGGTVVDSTLKMALELWIDVLRNETGNQDKAGLLGRENLCIGEDVRVQKLGRNSEVVIRGGKVG